MLATQHYQFDPKMGGNVIEQNWRADDNYGMYRLYQEHPEYFVPNSVTNFRNTLIGSRAVKEQIEGIGTLIRFVSDHSTEISERFESARNEVVGA